MKYLLIVLVLAGCGFAEDEEYACIDHTRFVKRGNIWSQVYGGMPCRPMEKDK